jgi:hypothetical protein
MQHWIIGGMTIFIILMATYQASAAARGASVTTGVRETAGVGSPGSVTTKGGNITNTNLTVTSQSTHWQGFWGRVTGSIALYDASGNKMMNWSVATVSGNVFISNYSTVTWTGLTAASASGCNRVIGTGADSCTNTFNDGTKTFFVGGAAVTSVNIVKTYNWSGAAVWDEGIINSSSRIMLYTATIYNAQKNFKNVSMSGFQAIVPVNGTATKTYYFWAELA